MRMRMGAAGERSSRRKGRRRQMRLVVGTQSKFEPHIDVWEEPEFLTYALGDSIKGTVGSWKRHPKAQVSQEPKGLRRPKV